MPEAWTESGSRRRSASNLLGEYGEPFFDNEISRVTDQPSAGLTDSSSHSLIGCRSASLGSSSTLDHSARPTLEEARPVGNSEVSS